MNNLKLLIVDDEPDNRLVLKAICKKLEGFEIKEASDGIEAVECVQTWQPHIILMDIMMPNMDGFEASKIIKERYPDSVIIVVTAVLDDNLQEKLSSIGVDIYINKPIERDLITYKLKSVGSALRIKNGEFGTLSTKSAVNLFTSDIRSFKTFFYIENEESMMDFGMWLFDQYSGKSQLTLKKFDKVVEIFYKLMSKEQKNNKTINIIIEESYEEFFITLKVDTNIEIDSNISQLFKDSTIEHMIKDELLCIRIAKPIEIKNDVRSTEEEQIKQEVEAITTQESIQVQENSLVQKEKKFIPQQERELLHQSFVNKTSAQDYVNDIGGDVLDEILDLASIDEEWIIKLHEIEENPSQDSFSDFADTVLNEYVKAINNLFEFTALAYALSSLGVFMKENAQTVSQDSKKVKTLSMLLEHLGSDLSSWREHIFLLQDTSDIHYLDSSFFSSCMQIEMIISDKEVANDDDDDDGMEFF